MTTPGLAPVRNLFGRGGGEATAYAAPHPSTGPPGGGERRARRDRRLRLGRPQLSLTALNFTDAFHRLYVQLHRTDRDERSEAFAFDAVYELAARGEEVTAVRDAHVVPTHPYIVRADVDGEARSHYHFFPDCAGHDEPEERLYVAVRPTDGDGPDADPRLTFGQNACGRDAWAL